MKWNRIGWEALGLAVALTAFCVASTLAFAVIATLV